MIHTNSAILIDVVVVVFLFDHFTRFTILLLIVFGLGGKAIEWEEVLVGISSQKETRQVGL